MANEENRVGVISCADHAEWFAETLAGRLAAVDGVGGSIEEQLDYYQRAMNRIVVIDDDVVYGNKQAEDIIVNWVKTQGSPRVRLIVFCDNDRTADDPFFYRLVSDADVHDILLTSEAGDEQAALLALIEEPATQLQYGRWKTNDTSIWEEKKKRGLFSFSHKKKKSAKKEKAEKKTKGNKKAKKVEKDQDIELHLDEETHEPACPVEENVDAEAAPVELMSDSNEPAEPGSLYDLGSDDASSDDAPNADEAGAADDVIPEFKPKKPAIDYSGLGDLDQKTEIDEGNLSSCAPTLAMPKLVSDPKAELADPTMKVIHDKGFETARTEPVAAPPATTPAVSGPMPVVPVAAAGQVVISLEDYNRLLLSSKLNVHPKATDEASSVENIVVAGDFAVAHDEYVAKAAKNEKVLEDEFLNQEPASSSTEDQISEESSEVNTDEQEAEVVDPEAELADSTAEAIHDKGLEVARIEPGNVPEAESVSIKESSTEGDENQREIEQPAGENIPEGSTAEEDSEESNQPTEESSEVNTDGQEGAEVSDSKAELADSTEEAIRGKEFEAGRTEPADEPAVENPSVDEAAKENVEVGADIVEGEKSTVPAIAVDPKLNDIVTAAIEGAKVNGDGTVSFKLPQGDYGAFVSALRDRNGNALGVVAPTARKTLAVAAVSHGLGATHTALALASELANHEVKTCAVIADEEVFTALAGGSEGIEQVNGCGLRWRGCDVYRWTDQHDFADDYDVAIVDCGVLEFEDENPSSPAAFFQAADEKLMIIGGTPWNIAKLAALMNGLGTETLKDWNFGGTCLSQETGVALKNMLVSVLADETAELWEIPFAPQLFEGFTFGNSAARYAMILKLLAPEAFKSVKPTENYAPKKNRNNRGKGKQGKQNQGDKPKNQG